MAAPDREGIFIATIMDCGVAAKNNKPQFVANYRLDEMLEQSTGKWRDVSGRGWTINGYHILEKNDGTVNTTQVKSIRAAIGWDGLKFSTLTKENHTGKRVRVTLQRREYNGQSKIEVTWIDNENSEGHGAGLKKAEQSEIERMEAAMEARLAAAQAETEPSPAPTTRRIAAEGPLQDAAPSPRSAQHASPPHDDQERYEDPAGGDDLPF